MTAIEHHFRHIIFTDESSFPLHHAFNNQNGHHWSQMNLYLVYPASTQYLQKVTVWTNIKDQHIVEPIFTDSDRRKIFEVTARGSK